MKKKGFLTTDALLGLTIAAFSAAIIYKGLQNQTTRLTKNKFAKARSYELSQELQKKLTSFQKKNSSTSSTSTSQTEDSFVFREHKINLESKISSQKLIDRFVAVTIKDKKQNYLELTGLAILPKDDQQEGKK